MSSVSITNYEYLIINDRWTCYFYFNGHILPKYRRCLVCIFKQLFLVFKQHFTDFYTLFHSYIFPQIFSNNNFQFLNICHKRAHNCCKKLWKFYGSKLFCVSQPAGQYKMIREIILKSLILKWSSRWWVVSGINDYITTQKTKKQDWI